MAELMPPDEIYVPFQKAIDYDLVAIFGVITGEVKYLWATPKREATDAMYEAVRKASQLASIATDWNLSEAEIDGEMVSVYDLLREFEAALALADGDGGG